MISILFDDHPIAIKFNINLIFMKFIDDNKSYHNQPSVHTVVHTQTHTKYFINNFNLKI